MLEIHIKYAYMYKDMLNKNLFNIFIILKKKVYGVVIDNKAFI